MRRVSRRWFLAAAAAPASLAALRKGSRVPAPRDEACDPLTGREIFRLSDRSILHRLPASHHRFVASDNSFLLLAAEHGGSRQLHRLDLERDLLVQVTDGPGVHSQAAHLRNNDRGFYFLQGNELIQTDLRGRRRKTRYRCPDGWALTGDMDISRNEQYAAVIETRAGGQQAETEPLCRLRIINLAALSRDEGRLAVEERQWISTPLIRPGRTQVAYVREGPWQQVRDRLQLVNFDGSGQSSLRPTRDPERIGASAWFPDGSRLRYVHYADGASFRTSLRSVQPERGSETIESECSAYGWFSTNLDGSALVGASVRPSGPNLYLLFPAFDREITLGEHASSLAAYPIIASNRKDSSAADPTPTLSPDGSWLYYVTDREGLPVLYGMPVDDLVEASGNPAPIRTDPNQHAVI